MLDQNRVQKELREIRSDTASGVAVEPVGDSLQHLTGFLEGPRDTPYEGGYFKVDIVLEPSYPFLPPRMRFLTNVWHPNISSKTGAICLDVLKDQWSPALTLKTALLSLQALLSTPQPDDPQDAVVAQQYLRQHDAFERQARTWTEHFAHRQQEGDVEAKAQRLVEMGFPKGAARKALKAANGDENAAMELLLTGGPSS